MRGMIKGAASALLLLSACGSAQTNDTLVPALEKLAAKNNAEAIYHLGMAYHTGTGVPRSPTKAFDAFRRAAQLGDPLASYKVGCYYAGQEGDTVQRDDQLALRHKLVAAKAGYALAQQDVAGLYAQQGDIPTALTWLERSAAQGWSGALATYASVYNGAPGIDPDAVKTAAYFELFLQRTEASGKQRAWLADFEKRLTLEQRNAAAAIVSSYRAVPTPLTLKGLSGQKAAKELVANR